MNPRRLTRSPWRRGVSSMPRTGTDFREVFRCTLRSPTRHVLRERSPSKECFSCSPKLPATERAKSSLRLPVLPASRATAASTGPLPPATFRSWLFYTRHGRTEAALNPKWTSAREPTWMATPGTAAPAVAAHAHYPYCRSEREHTRGRN
jgi:hypothetical protein